MPAPAHPADTVHAADAVEPYYAPQYVDGFPAAAPCDTVLGSINGLPVMEVPVGGEALSFARSPLHDTPSMFLLLVGLLAVTLCYHSGHKYIENFFHYMFSTRRRENLFEDHTVHETSIQAALVANTCIVEGFIIYFAVQLLWPALASSLQQGIFLYVAAYTGVALVFYAAQWVAYKVLGYTFLDTVASKLWIDGFKASQAFLGLVLLPVLFLLMLYPAHGKLLLWVAASLYLVGRLIFIIKGFRIFYSNLSSIIYFLLYLCAVEIVPLVLVTGLTYWFSGILQSINS
ncbi:MAG: DUF4271 domain-containing protein [Muribaculaceae bacterium]|nr:DUF4271 domain-containing protein [Muribaculaceae bacterium]